MAEQTSIRASCMCGAAVHTFTAPASSLPLPAYLCSCNTSRRISGALLTSYVRFPGDSKPDVSALRAYKSSDILHRHFCPTCGTQMYLEYADDGHFEVATGCLDRTDGIVDFKALCWIEDTVDGGATEFLESIGGRTLDRYMQEPLTSPIAPPGWKSDSADADTEKHGAKDKLYAHCHCGGVKLWLSRPEISGESRENPGDVPWWSPREGKFLGGSCACTSCRRSLGFEISWWCFPPIKDIVVDDGKGGTMPFQRNPYWGTLVSYRSSADVTRAFCGTCGCTFFWDGAERPMLVDLAIGTLDVVPGNKGPVRAEDWLNWRFQRVSFSEDALHRPLVEGLKDGLKAYEAKTKASAS